MKRLLAINGSYRPDGIMDQAIAAAAQAAEAAGGQVEVIALRDYPIGFCRNCRACTQLPGTAPGQCTQQDGMSALIERIEAADAYILASPTNFFSVTALFKRFMERLVVYAYWPWGRPGPQLRRTPAGKRAILLASCAAPGLMGRFLYGTLKQLKTTAQTLGARPIGSIIVGRVAHHPHAELDSRSKARIRDLVEKLLQHSGPSAGG